MNKLTEELTVHSRPVAALIVYSHDTTEDDAFSLECRPIQEDGLMGAGKPVTHDFMNKIASTFSERFSAIPYGPVPRTMLYADTRKGHERYVWHVPPGKRMMYFSRGLNIDNGEYHLPGLVFSVREGNLSVFAHDAKSVSEKTQLYSAPFFNTSASTGNVCLGSGRRVQPADLTYANLIASWEDLFFRTEFTHLTGGNPTRSNLVLVLKDAAERFDRKELVPIKGFTVQKLIK